MYMTDTLIGTANIILDEPKYGFTSGLFTSGLTKTFTKNFAFYYKISHDQINISDRFLYWGYCNPNNPNCTRVGKLDMTKLDMTILEFSKSILPVQKFIIIHEKNNILNGKLVLGNFSDPGSMFKFSIDIEKIITFANNPSGGKKIRKNRKSKKNRKTNKRRKFTKKLK